MATKSGTADNKEIVNKPTSEIMNGLLKSLHEIERKIEQISKEGIVIISYDSSEIKMKGVDSYIELKNVVMEGKTVGYITTNTLNIFY